MNVHSQQARKVVGWILGIVAFTSLALCIRGMNARVALSDVTGRVTYSGRPLDGGYICLSSDNGAMPAVGKLGSDGSFRLQTDTDRLGALPGLYHAFLSVRKGGTALPSKFCDPRTSGLAVEIASDWCDLNIDLH
jgi:hypothetical protein